MDKESSNTESNNRSRSKDGSSVPHMHKEMMRHVGNIHQFDHILHAHVKPIEIKSKERG